MIAIKCIRRSSQELHIAQFFTSLPDPQNHCVPVFDVFPDPLDSQWDLVVMPFLRPFNDPEFYYLGEIVNMVDQTLEVRLLNTRANHTVPNFDSGASLHA